jgi:radical SAM superfamily enzyme
MTTRVFTVEVTGCMNCPNKLFDAGYRIFYCTNHPDKYSHKRYDLYQQNKDQLTDSCPMWNETKESETK